MDDPHHVAVLNESDVKIPVRAERDGVRQIAGEPELRNQLLIGLHIAAQRVDYQPPYAGKRDGARLPFRLIVRRHVDGLISVVRHLADFAEKETELASSHALRWVEVKHQDRKSTRLNSSHV